MFEKCQCTQTAGLFPPYCIDFPCNTQSIAASNRLVWRKNSLPLDTVPIFKHGLENHSIENQKKIISLWAEQHELPISKFYVDIEYSGGTFQRPAFQQLIQDISTGKIKCVIVKDLLCVGRDHITVGYYIEKFFPIKNVRFVSVTDQFNTINGLTDQFSPQTIPNLDSADECA